MTNKICIIGLGYVGLPLACEFAKHFETIGYDFDSQRIKDLKKGIDNSFEVSKKNILSKKKLKFTDNIKDCRNFNHYIVAVPTPITKNKKPDLKFLKKASESVGKITNKNDLIIFESTVYPGVTEDICVPIIENYSKLKYNKDFFCGYSPERINPGDKKHTISNIKKITSGSNKKYAKKVDKLYGTIIKAGTHLVSSIKVAEASKIIENIQRDINIAFINELAMIFEKLEIDTNEIITAAGTKWNFNNFSPGLVGGHCIGVDPYYLTHIAKQIGHNPKIILAGRSVNESMASFVHNKVVNLMKKKHINIKQSNILIMGYTFKENCPDIRNTKVKDLCLKFIDKKCSVDVYDPWLNASNSNLPKKLNLIQKVKKNKYDCIILAVAHDEFRKMGDKKIVSFANKKSVIFDVKNILHKKTVDGRL